MNLSKYITGERTGLKYELIGDYYLTENSRVWDTV